MSPKGTTTTRRRPRLRRAGRAEAEAEALPRAKADRPKAGRPTGRTGRGTGTIDPRISARRTAVIRQQGRRRLRILVAGLVGTAVVVGGWFLLHSPLFSARAVTVVGAVHETAAQVQTASGLSSHTPLLDVDPGAVSARVEQLPWVKSATVSVSWPDGVRIALTEETPLAVVAEGANRWATVSADGRVLQVTAARPAGLRLLTVPAPAGVPGSLLPSRDGVGLLVSSTLPPSFAAQVTGVTVESGGWVQLSMTTPVVVDIGSGTQLEAKYEDVSSILAGATLQSGDVIDVSVPRAPTVTPSVTGG